jgi:hypothetical protein
VNTLAATLSHGPVSTSVRAEALVRRGRDQEPRVGTISVLAGFWLIILLYHFKIAAKPVVSVNTLAALLSYTCVPHSINAETLGISMGIVCVEAPTIARMVAYGKFLDDRTGFCHMEALG